jgi:hypothetical protein
MRSDGPSTYDSRILQSEIREFKRILRSTPRVSHSIIEFRWIDNDLIRVWTGGVDRPGGCKIDFVRAEGKWSLGKVVHYIA